MNREANIRGVILDMDGLILDTERPIVPLWIKAAKSLGWDLSLETLRRTMGVGRAVTEAVFLEEYGPGFPHEKFREILRPLVDEEFKKGISLKPGIIVLLDHLVSCSIPYALATSTIKEKAIWKLNKAGILDRFSIMACGDEITSGKPAPDIFLLAAERLKLDPAFCIGFEDSAAGLQGLHAAGIRSVFIKDLFDPPPEVMTAVWRRFDDLAQAVVLFEC